MILSKGLLHPLATTRGILTIALMRKATFFGTKSPEVLAPRIALKENLGLLTGVADELLEAVFTVLAAAAVLIG